MSTMRGMRVWVGLAALGAAASMPAMGSWFSHGQPVPQWGLDAAKTHTPD